MELSRGEVHVWHVAVGEAAQCLEDLVRQLDPSERARADAYRFARDRERFVVTRAALRTCLGAYLSCEPELIELAYGPHGKPYVQARGRAVAAGRSRPALQVSVSHAAGLSLLAFSQDGEIGVDVESIGRRVDALGIAERFFTPAEFRTLAGCSEDRAHELFLTLWTRKEAVLKAMGTGLTLDTRRVEMLPAFGDAVVTWCDEASGRAWTVMDLAIGPEHRGALAHSARRLTVRQRQWRCGTSPQLPQPDNILGGCS